MSVKDEIELELGKTIDDASKEELISLFIKNIRKDSFYYRSNSSLEEIHEENMSYIYMLDFKEKPNVLYFGVTSNIFETKKNIIEARHINEEINLLFATYGENSLIIEPLLTTATKYMNELYQSKENLISHCLKTNKNLIIKEI